MALPLPCRSAEFEMNCSEPQISIDPVWEALARHGGSPVSHTDMDSPKEMLRLENGQLVKQCETLFGQVSDLQEQLKAAQKAAAAAEARCKYQASLTAAEREQLALMQAECAELQCRLAESSSVKSHGSGSVPANVCPEHSERMLAEQVQELHAQLILRPSPEEHNALSSEVERLRAELVAQADLRLELQTLRADVAAKEDEIKALRSQVVTLPSLDEHRNLLLEVDSLKEQLQVCQLNTNRPSQPSSPLLSSRLPECPQAVPMFYTSRSGTPRQRPMYASLITPRSSAPQHGAAVLQAQTSSCSQPVSHLQTMSGRPQLAVTTAVTTPRGPQQTRGMAAMATTSSTATCSGNAAVAAGFAASPLETPRSQRTWSGQVAPSLDLGLGGCLPARAQSPKPSSVSLRAQAGRTPSGYPGTSPVNGCPSTPKASETIYPGLRQVQVARPPSSAWE